MNDLTLMRSRSVEESFGVPVVIVPPLPLPLQGSGLPFAGMLAVTGAGSGVAHTTVRPLVGRKDDAQFPPRGRPV